MKQIEEFLLKNGFEKVKSDMIRINYKNSKCIVSIHNDFGILVIPDKNIVKGKWFNIDRILNFYWLIGVLTWHDLIDKNYIK